MKTEQILHKVIADYEQISEEFGASRQAAWPEFNLLREKIEGKKIKLADIGCGNGRLGKLLASENVSYYGVDNNASLLALAKIQLTDLSPKAILRKAHMQKLPFKKDFFDITVSFAALHHLPTASLQLKALKEMRRITNKEGFVFITVWNLWQPKYKKHINPKNHHSFIPWGNPVQVERFYYAFKVNELKDLLKKAGFTTIRRLSSDHNFFFQCS